jgi:transposase
MTKKKQSTESAVREIRRRTRRKFSPEEKIRIVLEGLRGEQSISDLCRREGIAAHLSPIWRSRGIRSRARRDDPGSVIHSGCWPRGGSD